MTEENNQNQMPEEGAGWEAKAEEYKAGWQRAMADLDNAKKRMEQLRGEIAEFIKADMVVEFLPVLDDLKRALEAAKDNPEKVTEGLELVVQKFEKTLLSEGLEYIEPQPGDEFNPDEHEAVSHEESDKFNENHIIEAFETGLRVNSRVVRPAKVRVSKGNV